MQLRIFEKEIENGCHEKYLQLYTNVVERRNEEITRNALSVNDSEKGMFATKGVLQGKEINTKYKGCSLLNRVFILHELSNKYPELKVVCVVFTSFIIFIELMPLIIILISPTPYDYKVIEKQYKNKIEAEEHIFGNIANTKDKNQGESRIYLKEPDDDPILEFNNSKVTEFYDKNKGVYKTYNAEVGSSLGLAILFISLGASNLMVILGAGIGFIIANNAKTISRFMD